jgi:hypothetical protein
VSTNERSHVLIATDGSEQSIAAAKFLRTIVAPGSLDQITVLAAVRPLQDSPFVGEAMAVGAMALPPESWEAVEQSATAAAKEAVNHNESGVTLLER